MVTALLLSALLAGGTPAALEHPSLRKLVETADIAGVSVSPDGRLLAYRVERPSVAANRIDTRWFVAPTAGHSSPLLVGDGGAALWDGAGVILHEAPRWSIDSRAIYYRALIDGRVELRRAAADGSGDHSVVSDDADILDFAILDDHRIIYAVGATRDAIERAERREYDDGILIDATVDPAQNLFRGALINGRRSTQRLTGRWFERAGLLSSEPRHYKIYDLATGETRIAGDDEIDVLEAWTSSNGSSIVHSQSGAIASFDGQSDRPELRIQREDGEFDVCAAQLCNGDSIVSAAWVPGTDALIFTVEDEAHGQTLSLWNPAERLVRAIAGSEGLLAGNRDGSRPCALTHDAAFCVAATAASSPRVERIDLSTGARTIVADPNSRRRDRLAIAARHLDWSDPSGQRFTGVLFQPPAAQGPVPLFITYYRCSGYLRGGLGDEWPLAALAGAGIAALCVNTPPMGPKLADPVQRYDTALSGVRAAIAMLADQGLVDPTKVGMGGLSFGSEVTMWVAMNSDLLAAASIASSQIAPGYYWFNAADGRDFRANLNRHWGLLAPDRSAERWQLLSPALNACRISVPLLMQLPEQEMRLSMELYSRLSASTTPVELYAFPDEPHIKVLPRHKLAAYQRNLDWFRFWLQGAEDPDRAKVGQYERWRALSLASGRNPRPRPTGSTAPDRRARAAGSNAYP